MAAWDLVIFDNDGVLVDSELLANAALAELLSSLGEPTTPDESLERYLGGSIGRVRELVEAAGRPLPAEFERRYQAAVLARFAAGLEAVPGVAAAIDAIAGPRCVASSGTRERVSAALERTGLAGRFPEAARFSADDVAVGKPAPDLFLHAAAAMGAAPGRCAVVEDSALGVAAAKAAGMTCFGFTRATPPDRLAGADACFDDMADLPGLLADHAG